MQFPRCQATIEMADRPRARRGDDISPDQTVEISIIAAVAVTLGLSGQLTALVSYEDELIAD